MEMEERSFGGDPLEGKYGCPGCRSCFAEWRLVRAHLRQSEACRSSVHVADKRGLQHKCVMLAKVLAQEHHAGARSLGNTNQHAPCGGTGAIVGGEMVPQPSLCVQNEASTSGERSSSCEEPRKRDRTSAIDAVGRSIVGIDGRPWGAVVAEEKRSWRLASGRIARKGGEGRKWRWSRSGRTTASDTPEESLSSSSGTSTTPSESTSLRSRVSCSLHDLSTKELHCDSHSLTQDGALQHICVCEAAVIERVNAEVEWEVLKPESSCRAAPWCGPTPARRKADLVALDLWLVPAVDWLHLHGVRTAAAACREWAEALSVRPSLVLPPPQLDELLRFCLLEVLVSLDEARLPLPMTAIYGEMRSAARRAAANPRSRARLEELALARAPLGPSYRSQQKRLIAEGRPHHISWDAEIRSSSFRTVDKFAKHFHGERLIEVFHHRWGKRIHHSPNTRTCKEWLLTRVNHQHPLYSAHRSWSDVE